MDASKVSAEVEASLLLEEEDGWHDSELSRGQGPEGEEAVPL